MRPPFGLVVVHGDGSQVARLSVPRWIAYGVLGLQAAVLGLSATYALERGQMDSLRQRVHDQRVLLDVVQTDGATARDELAGWKALHAKIWKAFGPEADGERLSSVGEEEPALRDLKRVVNRTSQIMQALPLRWPVRGPVHSEFGLRRSPWTGKPEHHHGIDIGGPPGTPIRSPGAGTVAATSTHGRLGKHVAVDHGNGVRSLYGHLEAIDVTKGEQVAKGQVLGLVGNTGRSTGPHLHYELLVDGKPVNPRLFLVQR